ncbi:hypothetical protein ACFYNO_28605 [Kitasatospora sp. NPDC006697]|uniref:hypothetical protein n=1 Tax=Kitasatospora sp. NPDC006697 TaxID=3364020 RepID=UPI0036CC0D74
MVTSAGAAAVELPALLGADYQARWSQLSRRWAERPGTRLGTLGPEGTSSDVTARYLAERFDLRLALLGSFDEVLDELVRGGIDSALVPSASQGITRFHWHPAVRLQAFFPHPTPEYGIALPRTAAGPPAGEGPVRVATIWEVRRVYHEVVPAALAGRPVDWVDAASTQHAAELLAAGQADLAVTNSSGVAAHGLRWLARRPGAEIVWTVFGGPEDLDAR